MTWRVANSLDKLLEQLNEIAPNRSTVSDGSIGDAAHATRDSDHNPWVPPPVGGVVTARDFTNDPAHGANMVAISEALREARDPRIKYVIWDHRMFSSYPASGYAAWEWRPYSGINPHDHHMHVSVQPTPYLYDSSKAWDIEGKDWFDMATKEELQNVVDKALADSERRIKKMLTEHRRLIAVGEDRAYEAKKTNLEALKR